MKDIDFDELDRAVSSVLGADAKGGPEGDLHSAGVEVQSKEEPAIVMNNEAKAAVGQSTENSARKQTLVQRRSTGRFMDVVHPSSDMKSQKQAPSRQGVNITPVVKESAPDEAVLEVEAESRAVVELQPRDGVVADEAQAAPDSTHTFPDPLDFHGDLFSDTNTETSEDGEQEAVDTQTGEGIDTNTEAEQDALDRTMSELSGLHGLMQDQREMPPLDTPFVNDLAVEKRPLGAFSIDGSAEEEKEDDNDNVSKESEISSEMSKAIADTLAGATKDADDNKDHEDTSPGGGSSDAQAPVGDDVAEDTQVTPDAEIVPEELQGDLVAIESREVKAAAPLMDAAGSIPQQYSEKPADQVEMETTPVFDTSEYHQPLRQDTHKKGTWGIVLVVVLLALLGAGAGAAVYFFDPFNLL